jgi:dihydroorotase
MKILIRQAKICCTSSAHNGQSRDILIENGILVAIAPQIPAGDARVIALPDLHLSAGWVDLFAHFCDPGLEYRETLESGARAAAAGGFTDVLLIPNTEPVLHSKTQVEYIARYPHPYPVQLHPIGAITRNTAGSELAEMYDMRQSGAAAFSDGIHPVQSAGLLIKALQYVKTFNGTLIQVPDDRSIAPHALMHEGIVSTRLGLPGKPAMAEELMVARDIKLARYAGSRLHFTGVSSAKSLEYIRRAKDAGIQITCSVTPYHLVFTDEAIAGYDTNLKVNPPLRPEADRQALIAGLADGTIDAIASHHLPHHTDHKVCEFEYAKPGMEGLESLFGGVWQELNGRIPLQTLIEKLTSGPRMVAGLPEPVLTEGAAACITLFQPDETYIFGEALIRSRSKNNAFTGRNLRGKVTGVINGEKMYFV